MDKDPFTFISTFAGIGGFDLGFSRAGMVCDSQVEKDPSCLKLLGSRFPEVTRYPDIKEYSHHGKAVNLICGGFPCQDLSVAGRRAGLDGERSGLYFQFERLIDESRPRWFVLENVPGLLSSNGGRDFETILRGMVKLGYRVSWRILDSQFFRIPQRRRRVFIVGSLGDGRSAQVLFESEGLRRDTPAIEEAGKEDPARIGEGSQGDRGDGKIYQWASGAGDDLKDTAQTLRSDAESNYQFLMEEMKRKKTPTLTSHQGGGNTHPQGSEIDFIVPDTALPLKAHHARNNVDETFIMAHGQGGAEILEGKSPTLTDNHEAPIAFTQNSRSEVRKIGEGGNIVGAIASEAGAQQQNYISQRVGLRRLTPLECERLQGFPDGWTQGFPDTVRYRMLGNAVSVPVAEWIAKRIMKVDKEI